MMRNAQLHQLLAGKTAWDEPIWSQAERYLLANTSRHSLVYIVSMAGGQPAGVFFKADLVRLLRDIPPQKVLLAWEWWREQSH